MHENAQAQLLAQADSQAHTHLQVALVSLLPKAFLDVVPYGRLCQRWSIVPAVALRISRAKWQARLQEQLQAQADLEAARAAAESQAKLRDHENEQLRQRLAAVRLIYS